MHRFSIPFGMHNNNNTNYTANGWGINGWNDGTTVMKSIEKKYRLFICSKWNGLLFRNCILEITIFVAHNSRHLVMQLNLILHGLFSEYVF